LALFCLDCQTAEIFDNQEWITRLSPYELMIQSTQFLLFCQRSRPKNMVTPDQNAQSLIRLAQSLQPQIQIYSDQVSITDGNQAVVISLNKPTQIINTRRVRYR
jgi:hypothetical protein